MSCSAADCLNLFTLHNFIKSLLNILTVIVRLIVHLAFRKSSDRAFVGDEELPARKSEAVTLPEHEKNADLVRYRAVRYEPRPEIWQKVACVWDQVQTRPNQFHQYESDSLFPAISASTVRYGNSRLCK